MCSYIHNSVYSGNGTGVVALEVFSTIFDMCSECVMTLLVLMLANGWFTRYQKFDYDEGLEIYGPLFVLILMVHIVIGAFTFIDQDAYHKYHDFHGWVGTLIISAKIILVFCFLYFYQYSKDKISKAAKPFYQQFVMVGLMFLLSDPMIILSCFFLKEYNRQFYYRFADQSIHIFLQTYIFF